jgi:hypothetical protein
MEVRFNNELAQAEAQANSRARYSFEVLLQNIGIVCERGPEWSERLCGTCIKIKCAFFMCIHYTITYTFVFERKPLIALVFV